MINVCTECLKLNPLEMATCHYCSGKCEQISNARLNTFWIELNDRKREKEALSAKKIDSKEETNERGSKETVERNAENGL